MNEHRDNGSPGESFAERLERARRKAQGDRGPKSARGSLATNGIGLGMRIGLELVVGIAVGGGLGYGLDWLLGTMPLLLVLGLFLGLAAGVLNAYRAVHGLDETVGVGQSLQGQRRDQTAAPDGKTEGEGDSGR